jgi:hypothetical protein
LAGIANGLMSPQSAASHLPLISIVIYCGWPLTSVVTVDLPL